MSEIISEMVADLTMQVVSLKEEVAVNKQTIEQLQSEVDNLTDSTTKLTEENVCYKQEISQLERQVQSLTSSQVALSEENAGYKQSIANCQYKQMNTFFVNKINRGKKSDNSNCNNFLDLRAQIVALDEQLTAEKNKAQSWRNAGEYYREELRKQNERLEKQERFEYF